MGALSRDLDRGLLVTLHLGYGYAASEFNAQDPAPEST